MPPETLSSTAPLAPPWQPAATVLVEPSSCAWGCATTMLDRGCVQPLASVTSTLYVPCGMLARSWVVAVLDQANV